MIIHIRKNISEKKLQEIKEKYNAKQILSDKQIVLITSSAYKTVGTEYLQYIESHYSFDNDIQLASREYISQNREVTIKHKTIGGNGENTMLIAGPCAVESQEQMEQTAQFLKTKGFTAIRAGSFKPRTSPYSFQGLEKEGLKILSNIREKYDLAIVTEVKDATHADLLIDFADVVQIGAKSMYDHGILKKCSQTQKPIMIKRGFGSTVQEFVQAAEFVLSGGNNNVILCERGIRTFETKTRFTLDLCSVAYLKNHINLPIILDPSHAMGAAYGVPDLARACMAMGTDGLLIEIHPTPKNAKSDAAQQLSFDTFDKLYQSLIPIANAVGKKII